MQDLPQTDSALREAQELQSIAEDAAGAGFWSLDLKSGRQYCSPGLFRLLEREPGEAPGNAALWQTVLHPDDRDSAAALVSQALADGKPFYADYRIVMPDGAFRWIEVHGKAGPGPGGSLRLSGYCLDITRRRIAEEEFHEIKERQDFLLKLSDALAPLSDPLEIQLEACRVLGQHLKVNRVFYAEADETGLNRAGPQYIDGVPPTSEIWNSRDYDPSLLSRYLSGETLTCDDVSRNMSLGDEQRKAYAEDQIVAWAAAPIAKPGMPLGRLVIHQNSPRRWQQSEIALIKETAERVWPAVQRARSQSEKQAAEAASIAKSQFLSVMSHELRTPLNVIMNMFELIRRARPAGEVDDYAARGLRSSEHLLSLVTDILDFSSIEAGRLVLAHQPFGLGQLLEEVSTLSAGKHAEGVALKVNLDPALADLVLEGDALRLKQVLINLAGNALKFTERGSVDISVTPAGGPAQAPLLEYAVTDTGIGMTGEQTSRLFKPFTQVDMSNERRYGGSGLGLIISNRLVKQMGGEAIRVESEPGTGSRFSFLLALPRAAGGLRRDDQDAPAPAPEARRLAGLRILLVEDSETARFALRLLLEAEGAKIEEAVNGAEGLAMAAAASPPHDIVLMDMQMPKMNGLEATRELRLRGYRRPILALTANAFARDLEACLAAGMDDSITKPVKIDALVEALRRNLRP